MSAAATLKAVRSWMIRNYRDCIDNTCNEVNMTQLAENAAHHFDHDEWLDIETHWVWDLAFRISQLHDKERS